jgi:hypothetical protein
MAEITRQRVQESYTSSHAGNPARASGFVILNTNLATLNRGDAAPGIFAEAIWDSDLSNGASNHSTMIAVDVPSDARVFVPFYVCTATLTSIDASGPCAITKVATTASTGAGKFQIYGSVPVSSNFNQALPSSIVTGAAPTYQASLTVPVSGTYLAANTTLGEYTTASNGAINNVAMFNQYLDGTDGGVATLIAPLNFGGSSTTTFYGSVSPATVLGSEPWGIPVNGLTRLTATVVDAFGFTFTASDANNTSATVSNARVMLGGYFAG